MSRTHVRGPPNSELGGPGAVVKVVAIALCGTVLMGCAATPGTSSYCRRQRRPAHVATNVPPLHAGEYRLTLHADCGRRSGSSSEASLTLVPASATDRSSTSGAVVVDLHGPPQLYGWTPLKFQSVDAPICDDDGLASPATSQDPMRPGALVPPKERADPPVILIGTLSNLRTGSLYLDGCGIGLFVHDWDGACYRGAWGNLGIVSGGSGTFSACLVRNLDPATM